MSEKIYNEEKEEPPDSRRGSIDQSELSSPAPPNVTHKPVKSLSKSFYSDLQVSQAGDIIITGEWKVGKPRSEDVSKANLTISYRAQQFRQRFFPEASDTQWNDWRWQIRHRIIDLAGLESIVHLSSDERDAILRHSGSLPVAITPYYASLVDPDDPQQPIRKSVIMVSGEYQVSPEESIDPLAEDKDSPVPGLIHRYPDRALFLTTGFCAVYCRYCTRSRLVGNLRTEHRFNTQNWEKSIAYLEAHKEVRDVILSGGDPLTLGNNKLEWLLRRLRQIPHLEVIRLGTKVPVVLPQRITNSFVNMLKQYHPLWMSIHFTHPDELTPETIQACNRLADAGLPLGSQTVLLKGINDNVETMKRLTQGLMKIRVKPYYLYQCDPVKGSAHFRTAVDKGLEIIAGLRGFTSGYAVPSFVIDSPGGGGKIPLLPEYVIGRDGDDLLLRNYEGKIFRYPDSGGTVGKNIQNSSKK
ncbi:KamA family radical SAM protein [bacterium]|nr:KamA family radical SAM protein [bacterium]MBU1635536.1 KamA family radical SAM protein [bacterium]MBU1874136.1 KamA family radical SAM protein [bacterium]